MTYVNFNDIKLDLVSSVKRNHRTQVASFGDGYAQVLTDGLNSQQEAWNCKTIALTNEEINSLESYLLSLRGTAIEWTPPFNTKTFSRPFASGQLDLGYKDIDTLSLNGYTRPTNYTANLDTGLLTSVDIADGTVVEVTLTLDAGNYLLTNGWTITPVSPAYATLEFELRRVYV